VTEDIPEAGLLAITSPDRLHRDWRAARFVGETSVAERLLARRRPGSGLVTVGDFHPATLSWLGAVAGNTIVPLGVDRFGQSGDIPDLYRAHGIDSDAILDAAARACLTTLQQQDERRLARQLESITVNHIGCRHRIATEGTVPQVKPIVQHKGRYVSVVNAI
jgi:pyruvate dehydrogenase complex dehydrogenase (E1) component